MATPLASDVLNREFLGIRSRLVDLAATLDRIGRGEGEASDPRLAAIRRSLELLAGAGTDRAERIQHLFSLPYAENWREEFGLKLS
jgi:hypothetical protein